MFEQVSKDKFVSVISRLDGVLSNIRLSKIEIKESESKIKYTFVCDKTVSDELKTSIRSKCREMTSSVFKFVSVEVVKMSTDSELINNEIFNYLKNQFPSLSVFFDESDITSSVLDGKVKYLLKVTPDCEKYFAQNGSLKNMEEYLGRKFCADFYGGTELKELPPELDFTNPTTLDAKIEILERRTIKVENVELIDDISIGDTAEYIEDATSGTVIVCGNVTEITEKQTKTGKPFFIIRIDDTTGKLGGIYFSKKSTLDRIRKIAVGDSIIARGSYETYNDKSNFKFEKINGCKFIAGFKKKSNLKTIPPLSYSKIFPEGYQTVKEKNIFDKEEVLPKELTEKEYVVFDLETTGTDYKNDSVTEIGAVKLKGGKIVESFTTLIDPEQEISEKIVSLTGITNEMVKGAPKIEQVMPDFLKFIYGTTIVAHNADFDTAFIKRDAEKIGYAVSSPVMDTMILSRELLPMLRNNKLNVVAEHFGITFNHHRGLSDAVATAECFIALMKLKYNKK